MMKIERLLLATDFSTWAGRAEEYACSLAATWHAHLTAMTVLEFPPGLNPEYPVNHQYLTHRMSEATEQLADFKQRALHRGIAVSTRIATGIPSEEIHAAAQAEDSHHCRDEGQKWIGACLIGQYRRARHSDCTLSRVGRTHGEGCVN